MRTMLLFISFVLTFQAVQAQGIRFVKGSLDEVLSLAQKEKKLVFIDAYTTWCGPCRAMTKNVFPKKDVGTYFNEHFISTKIDMEKGEGPAIGLKYIVKSYPTMLFIDSEGTLVHKVAGYQSAENLIKQAQKALSPESNLGAMRERFEIGDRDPAFLLKYLDLRYSMGDYSQGPVLEEYLKTQKDWTKPKILRTIYKYIVDADSAPFQFMVEHKDLFYRLYGAPKVGKKIQVLLEKKMNNPDVTLDELQAIYRKVYPGKTGEIEASKVRMTYYRRKGNRNAFAQAALNHFKKYPSQNSDELNEVGITFYENINKRKYLKKVIKLVKKSIELDSNMENNLTLGQLYFKLKKKKKARKAVLNAISLAKAQDEDYDDAEEFLKQIEKR
ncbi:MAG TPA: thioredoxin family protein [Saprospiraceae bacterium]|nr:thioredoxin family protein [Saprospiraceae bacterium]